jgi:hypothetical protein
VQSFAAIYSQGQQPTAKGSDQQTWVATPQQRALISSQKQKTTSGIQGQPPAEKGSYQQPSAVKGSHW